MSLIKMYQERLAVSKSRAEDRAMLFVVTALLTIGLVVLMLIVLPFQETRIEKIQLIPGNHTWTEELPTHEFLPLELIYEQHFSRLVDGKETNVSQDVSYIIYEFVERGKPFKYREYYNRSFLLTSYEDRGESPEIRDGVLTRRLHRNPIVIPILVIICVVMTLAWIGPGRRQFISPKPRSLRT